MISIYFEDSHGNELGTALFGAMPQLGDIVTLELTAGYPEGMILKEARLRVESTPRWHAFNYSSLMEWMVVFRSNKEAYATLVVSADNDETQRYIDGIRAENEGER